MYETLYTTTNALFAQFFAPARRFNSLVIENLGKVAEFQLDAARSYAEIGLRPLREALGVADREGFQRLMASQNDAGRTLVAKLMADAQTLIGIGQTFGQDVRDLLMQGVDSSMVCAAATNEAAKTAAAVAPTRKPA